jgi:hypothetical protein
MNSIVDSPEITLSPAGSPPARQKRSGERRHGGLVCGGADGRSGFLDFLADIAVNPSQIDHERRAHDQVIHAEAPTHRELIIVEGAFESGDGGFDGGTRVARFVAGRAGGAPPLGEIAGGLIEVEGAARLALTRLGRALGQQRAIGRARKARGLAARFENGGLAVRAREALGLIRGGGRWFKIGQHDVFGIRRGPAKGGLNLGNRVRTQCGIDCRAAEVAIDVQGVDGGAFEQGGQRVTQEFGILGGVRGGAHVHDQLEGIASVAGLGEVGDVAAVARAAFGAMGGVEIIGRLDAVGAKLGSRFRLNGAARFDDFGHRVGGAELRGGAHGELFAEDACQELIGFVFGVSRLEFEHERLEEFAEVLHMRRGRLAFEVIHELAGRAAQIRGQPIGVVGLIGFAQHPLDTLGDFDQQLQAAQLANVAGDLRAIHAQATGLQFEGGDLCDGDLAEGFVQQILAGGLLMRAEAMSKVVDGAQIEFAHAQIFVAEGIEHLQVEGEGVHHFGIAPIESGFERFQTDEDIDEDVGPRGDVAVQTGEGALVEALVHFAPEGGGPGVGQPFALGVGQQVQIAEQGGLMGVRIRSEHAGLTDDTGFDS